MMNSFMQETRASIRNLEVQIGQLSKKIPERSSSTFSGDTVVNPREDCKAIELKSGKVAGSEAKVNDDLVEKEAPEEKKEEVEHAPPKRANNPFSDSLDTYPTLPKAPEYKPKLSYPQRLQKASKDKQFSRFLEVFKKLQINIPFAEALEQMPLYAKFMKELLTNKRN
ncbi:Retrotransposon gag protein [Arachis hypogaea]|nr:Retrotransposon gag protein [Arachis hypogaea]